MEMIQAVTPIIINGLSLGVLLAICVASKIIELNFNLWLIGYKLRSKNWYKQLSGFRYNSYYIL